VVTDLNRYRRKKALTALSERLHEIYSAYPATAPFSNLHLPSGIPEINQFIWSRLDREAHLHGDFIIVTDVGFKHALYIDFEVCYPDSNFDYEKFIDAMINRS
jgi:hypothetical protein